MTAADMPPGPRAYHALIFAHARAGNAAGALAAIRREYTAGDIATSSCLTVHFPGQFNLPSGDCDMLRARPA